MTPIITPSTIMLLIALASLGCTIFVTVRAKHWRDTDEGKTMLNKIKVDHAGLDSRVQEHHDRIGRVETKLETMPTKADIARLESDVRSMMRELGSVDAGVKRIEQFMMERGV